MNNEYSFGLVGQQESWGQHNQLGSTFFSKCFSLFQQLGFMPTVMATHLPKQDIQHSFREFMKFKQQIED